MVETIDGDALDRLLEGKSTAPKPAAVKQKGAGAAQIAAAEGPDWGIGSDQATPVIEEVPPAAAG